jgi:hypothetical protein
MPPMPIRRHRHAAPDDPDTEDADALELRAQMLMADLRNVVGEMAGLLADDADDDDE